MIAARRVIHFFYDERNLMFFHCIKKLLIYKIHKFIQFSRNFLYSSTKLLILKIVWIRFEAFVSLQIAAYFDIHLRFIFFSILWSAQSKRWVVGGISVSAWNGHSALECGEMLQVEARWFNFVYVTEKVEMQSNYFFAHPRAFAFSSLPREFRIGRY